METIDIKIDGMTCQGCVKSVERVLSNLQGVNSFLIDFDNGKASITFDKKSITIESIVQAIDDAGFEAIV